MVFFESLFSDLLSAHISRGSKGQIDPYAAAGISYGLGNNFSDSETARLGSIIGAQGGFDNIATNSPTPSKPSMSAYHEYLMEKKLEEQIRQTFPAEILESSKGAHDAIESLWKSYVDQIPDHCERLRVMWDNALEITRNVDPIIAAVLIGSFLQHSYWHTNANLWHESETQLKTICTEKGVDWDIVDTMQTDLYILRKFIEEQLDSIEWRNVHNRDEDLSARYVVYIRKTAKLLPVTRSILDQCLSIYILLEVFLPPLDSGDAAMRLCAMEMRLKANGFHLPDLIEAYSNAK